MSAYVISAIEESDAQLLQSYRELAEPSVEKFGGRYIARGGAVEILEGPTVKSLVILEFPNMSLAREWYDSPEYAEALKIGRLAFKRQLVFVEGL